MPFPGLPPNLLSAMGRGAVVLTPTVRAARQLSGAFDEAQRRQGFTSWQPARIVSWNGWMAGLWAEATVAGKATAVLLNNLQEKALWQQILERAEELGLQMASSVATLCAGALHLLGGYDLHNRFAQSTPDEVSDFGAFTRWYRDFAAVCRREGLLPASYLDLELAERYRSGALKAQPEYILYGFDVLPPSRRALTEALAVAGASVEHIPASSGAQRPPVLVQCQDRVAEIAACCEWVRSCLQSDAGARLCIVVPDLDECRLELERALRTSVAPWLQDITSQQVTVPFEFSNGRPLSQLPMIADVLRLLHWCAGPVSFADAGAILRSPFLGLAPSPESGAELEAWTLLDTQRVRPAATLRGEVSLSECERIVRRDNPHTADRLRELQRYVGRTLDGRHTFAGFADRVRRILPSAGWSVEGLDSAEFQASQRWDEVLDRVASLDLFGERLTFPEWLESVESAAADTMFSPENTSAPVQVVTVAEAIGSTCDGLWFLHADERTWPPRREPHPLLGRSLQNSLGMPGNNPAADEAADHGKLLLLVAGAGAAHFSYGAHGLDGDLQPSPSVEAIPGLLRVQHSPTEPQTPVMRLDEAEDPSGLPTIPQHAAGGISILTSQAQCGFRAFAERRLHTRDMESLEAGLSAAERGEQVHAVLQKFWSICKTHQELVRISKTLNDNGKTLRSVLLDQCIAEVLPRFATDTWDAAYLQVQRKRLQRLLTDWLDVELARTPFVVSELEYGVPAAEIGHLRFNIRVDRIDSVETPAGPASVLIDYKTGAAERAGWFGERPDAPQLPAYAIAGGIQNVQGIAFARVRVGKQGMNFEEMLADQSLLGNVKRRKDSEPGFDERLEEWQRDLTALANAFARGDAAVDPKDYLTTCKGCASRLLCRMDVARLEPADDLLEEGEEEGGV